MSPSLVGVASRRASSDRTEEAPSQPEVAPSHASADERAPLPTAGGHQFEQVGNSATRGSSGRSLPRTLRRKMEAAFGADFSAIRVHEGVQPRALGGIAFTRGERIHVAPGHYQPQSEEGQRVLGHELAHVLQQRAGRVAPPESGASPINTSSALEAEADALGTRAAMGLEARPSVGSTGAASGASQAPAPVQLMRDPPRKRTRRESYYPSQFNVRQVWYDESTSQFHAQSPADLKKKNEDDEEEESAKTSGRSTWGPATGTRGGFDQRDTLFSEMKDKDLAFEQGEDKRFFDLKSATWYPFPTAPVDHAYEQEKIHKDQVEFSKSDEGRKHFAKSQFSRRPLYLPQEGAGFALSEEGRRLGFNFTPNLQLTSHRSNSTSVKNPSAPTGEFFSTKGPLAPFFGTLLHKVGEQGLDQITTRAEPLSEEDRAREESGHERQGQGWGDWARGALHAHSAKLGLNTSKERAVNRSREEFEDRQNMHSKAEKVAKDEAELVEKGIRHKLERYKGYPPTFEMRQDWFNESHSQKMANKRASSKGRSTWRDKADGEIDHRDVLRKEMETKGLAYEGKMGPRFLDVHSGGWTPLEGAPVDHAYEQAKIRDDLFQMAKNKKDRESLKPSPHSHMPLFVGSGKDAAPTEEARRLSFNWLPNLQFLSHTSNSGAVKPDVMLTQDFYSKSAAFGPFFGSRLKQVKTGERQLMTTTASPHTAEDQKRLKSDEPLEGQGWGQWSRAALQEKSAELGIVESRARAIHRDDREYHDQTQIAVRANRFARESALDAATLQFSNAIQGMAEPDPDGKARARLNDVLAMLKPRVVPSKAPGKGQLKLRAPPPVSLNEIPSFTSLDWHDPELAEKKRSIEEAERKAAEDKDKDGDVSMGGND